MESDREADNDDHSDNADADDVDDDSAEAETDGGGTNDASWDLPLYLNASVTLAQCILLIMAYSLSQKLSQESLQQLLELLSLLLPAGHILPKTKHLFSKFFSKRDSILCTYCSLCHSLITEEAVLCSTCSHPVDRKQLLSSGNFFIYIPVQGQLTEILQMHELQFNKSLNDGSVSDIFDGRKYTEFLRNQQKPDGQFITLTLNSDGVPVFKSSLYSLWPMLRSINELPRHQRKKHILMPGLWCGSIKPVFSTFFQPFITEINRLREHGFLYVNNQGNAVKFYVTVLVVTCDSVARCLLQNIKQFNGAYGCNWCLHEGVRQQKGRGYVRVYPFDDRIKNRNHQDNIEHARLALQTQAPIFGVKGPSPLLCLPDLNTISGFVVDYMHCIDLGVTRYLAALWFDKTNHHEPWFVGNQLEQINNRLTKIRPPNTITRLPRSLACRKFWKAAEWRAFLLFYSFYALNGILPTKYVSHIMLLSQAMFLLLQDNITQDDLFQADMCIRIFVQTFETLYGRQYMTFNLHLLQHMTDSVRDWGPLWCFSNYTFENVNGVLLNMFHGTQAVGKQITRTFLLFRNIKALAAERSSFMIPAAGVCLNNFLYKKRKLQSAITVVKSVTLIGKPVLRELTADELVASERLLGFKLNGVVQAAFYSKAIIDEQLYHSLSYLPKRSMRRNNYTVLLDNGDIAQLCNFAKLDTLAADVFVCFCNVFLTSSISVGDQRLQHQCASNEHIRLVTGMTNTKAVRLSCLRQKCILIKNGHENVICILPNRINDLD